MAVTICSITFSTAQLLLVIAIHILLVPYIRDSLEPQPATICLVNLANNPRTASLFSRGVLEQHGSKNTFSVVVPSQGCHPSSERLLLVQHSQLVDWCLGPEICILTGDEECHAPALGLGGLHEYLLASHLFHVEPETVAGTLLRDPPSLSDLDHDDNFDEVFDQYAAEFDLQSGSGSGSSLGVEVDHNGHSEADDLQRLAVGEGLNLMRPNVILREFYSSKYDYPAVVLGARFEFVPVSEKERDAGNRHYLFNFMGSIKVGQERDREHLRDVLNSHNWTMPTHVRMFDQLVRNPDTSTVEEYRDTLLASSFTLAPVGTADDCFRFWEAIEAGSIPIFVRRMGNAYKHQRCPDAFEDVLAADPPIVLLNDWDELPDFAEHVTEEQIDDLRRRMVVWAKEWWTKTAAIVDDAIERALVSRNQALAELTDEQLEFRTKEVSSALHALKEQQSIARRSSKVSAMENKAVKQKEAQERRQKQKIAQEQQTGKHPLSDDVGDDIGATELDDQIVAEIRSSTTLNDEQIEAAISSLREEAKKAGGGTIEATQDRLASLVTSSKVLADADLRHPTFEWVHSVAVSIIESCGYHRNSFVELELDGSSVLMQ
eukprot:INCI7251.6.p1 GENE.INCI7251.6~~INCI7251.6.p1  ORF type:complete len:603 (-),score=117.21 INCI7251.6:591-2399(-)